MENEENDGLRIDYTIYNGEPQSQSPEQEAAKLARQRAMQAKLPKFDLSAGEEFYIPREKLTELNETYFEMLDGLRAGFNTTPADMRSYMESVVFASYKGEIASLQREGKPESLHRREVYGQKVRQLTPAVTKKGFFRKRYIPNEAMRLCMQEAEIETEVELSKYRGEIAKQEEFLNGDGVREIFGLILELTVPRRKQKKFIRDYGEYMLGLLGELVHAPQSVKPQAPAPVAEERGNEAEETDESGYEGEEIADDLDELGELEEDFEEESEEEPDEDTDGEETDELNELEEDDDEDDG